MTVTPDRYIHLASGIYACSTSPQLHVDQQLKACPSCFPVAKKANCRDCEHWTLGEGIYGLCRGVQRVHATHACTSHTALKGLYP